MSDELLIELLNNNIRYIQNNIDEKYKSDFDRNLNGLKVKRVHGVNDVLSTLALCHDALMLGLYSVDKNTLLLFNEHMETIRNMYKDKDNSISSRLILHELFHMASSCKNKYSGVNTINNNNTGLNEGITELLSFIKFSNVNLNYSGYLYELLLTIQLSSLIGKNKLYDAYFITHNLDDIKNSLNIYINDINRVNEFFINFQKSLENRINYNDLSLVGKLQSFLVEALNNKNINIDFYNNYKNYIITPELVMLRGNDNMDIRNIADSVSEFKKVRKRDI